MCVQTRDVLLLSSVGALMLIVTLEIKYVSRKNRLEGDRHEGMCHLLMSAGNG